MQFNQKSKPSLSTMVHNVQCFSYTPIILHTSYDQNMEHGVIIDKKAHNPNSITASSIAQDKPL